MSEPATPPHTIVTEDFLKTILHWQHPRGAAHCLARLYFSPDLPRPVAIVSEIRTNPDGYEIMSEFTIVAESLIRFASRVANAHFDNARWIAHHGEFSYYDSFDDDTFTDVRLKQIGSDYTCEVTDYILITPTELRKALNGINIEPVPEALSSLGWHQPSW